MPRQHILIRDDCVPDASAGRAPWQQDALSMAFAGRITALRRVQSNLSPREARLHRGWIMLTAIRSRIMLTVMQSPIIYDRLLDLPRWYRGGHIKQGPVRPEGVSRSEYPEYVGTP